MKNTNPIFPFKRVNLFSGPGAGKSRMAAKVFAHFKDIGYCPELVQEFCKEGAWENRKWHDFDQFYIFGQQIHRELIPLRGGVDFIVTDSPLMLQYAYAKKYNVPAAESLWEIATAFEKQYPSVNVFLRRNDRKYEQRGRYEDLEKAKEMDRFIMNHVETHIDLDADDLQGIINFVANTRSVYA